METQFDKLGLKPAGTKGYLQPVRFETRQLTESSLELIVDGKAEPVAAAEATLSSRGDVQPLVEAPMVFVGYGMSIPGGGPRRAQRPRSEGEDRRLRQCAAARRRAGQRESAFLLDGRALGHLETRRGDRQRDDPQSAAQCARTGRCAATGPGQARAGRGGGRGAPTTFVLADPELQDSTGQTVAMTITRRGADRFFAGSGHTFEEIEALARENKPLPRFPLAGDPAGESDGEARIARGPERGGPAAGVGPPRSRTNTSSCRPTSTMSASAVPLPTTANYNGAMDDASGVASVLEVARLLKESGAKPKRSIVFLTVAPRSAACSARSTSPAGQPIPAKAIVADINLDMFLPLYALKVLEVQGLTESTLGDQVRAAAKGLGVEVQTDREPEQNRFIRSDQYSFIRSGVPALAFKFGYEFGSPEEKIRRDWVRDRYHKPSDDLNQPVDTAAAALFNRVIAGLLQRVADDPARPAWKDDSFFKRFAR